jgi:segregation and condensation protein B
MNQRSDQHSPKKEPSDLSQELLPLAHSPRSERQDSSQEVSQESSGNDGGNDGGGDSDEGVSLEELSQVYAKMMGLADPESTSTPKLDGQQGDAIRLAVTDQYPSSDLQELDSETSQALAPPARPQEDWSNRQVGEHAEEDDDRWPVTPAAILEAVLLVGRPDGAAITATQIAALMRGVSDIEVDRMVEELNRDYEAHHRALRIAAVGGGYRMQLADDLESVKEAFLGNSRPVRLSQAAIDCLALVSYQSGISRDKLDDQLGKSCGAVLNQLVRRRLLEMRRKKQDGRTMSFYYPTERLLQLVGLESFDDLPTAEEWIDRV